MNTLPRRSAWPCLLLLCIAVSSACAQRQASTIASALTEILKKNAVPGMGVSIQVLDLRTGDVLFSEAAQELRRPASTQKILTAAAYLRTGAPVAPTTELLKLSDGSLVLRGSGDALFSQEDLETLLSQAQDRLGGKIPSVLVDSSRFEPPHFGKGWMWDDEPFAFMPYISALTIERGTVQVRVSLSTGQVKVETTPDSAFFSVQTLPSATSGRFSVTRGLGALGRTILVGGSTGSTSARISVPDPDLFVGMVLARGLKQRLALPEEPPVKRADGPVVGTVLASLTRPLQSLLEAVLADSDNLAAECLLRLGTSTTGTITAEMGLARVARHLESLSIPKAATNSVDGSGVSHYNLLTAATLVTVLKDLHLADAATRKLFLDGLAVAGQRGTLARRMLKTAADGRIYAKTGTINSVSNLAGYVMKDGEPVFAFAILCQSFTGPSSPARALQDALCTALVKAADQR